MRKGKRIYTKDNTFAGWYYSEYEFKFFKKRKKLHSRAFNLNKEEWRLNNIDNKLYHEEISDFEAFYDYKKFVGR